MSHRRVIVIDDDIAVRQAFVAWLSEDYEVQCFESAESFIESFKNFDFEDGIQTCLLLDFQLPGMTGVELQTSLRLLNAEFPILFISGNAQPADVIDAWNGGAINFLLKPFTASQISNAIDDLFAKIEKDQLLIKSSSIDVKTIAIPINQREAQVLSLLGQGLQQVEAAKILGLSLRTIKMYRASLKEKLNLNTLMELARYYDQHRKSIENLAGNSIHVQRTANGG